ncbi:hypothetical protein Mrub_1037 [Meiothermus ruber DSM 1279]|jgi:hypothetical protein|uniref:Uncharacterized protein n=1 Tax=Meiothermus ruber (strain ATCC 35948 / DSM 1279 / VKM B-1258 / 21) TaxID=504728 RepID=A0A806CRU6_MEIRD|nr:hypothetical protein Mrub_1037 [Meiothermus ruber DSM 1279]GAO74731.1 putative uncharacterized protein [Meiothermus ruber H328]
MVSTKPSKGYILISLAVALVLLGLLLVPLGLLTWQNATRKTSETQALQALYLAEGGAEQAVAHIRLSPLVPLFAAQPILICRTSSSCTPSSPDYVGRYCFSSGSLGGLACSATRSLAGGKVRWTIYAVGEERGGVTRRLRWVYNATDGVVEQRVVDP